MLQFKTLFTVISTECVRNLVSVSNCLKSSVLEVKIKQITGKITNILEFVASILKLAIALFSGFFFRLPHIVCKLELFVYLFILFNFLLNPALLEKNDKDNFNDNDWGKIEQSSAMSKK